MLEATIESVVVAHAEAAGFWCRKVVYLGRRNAADHIFARKDRGLVFIEFKRLGKKPNKTQSREHDRMVRAGIEVHRSVDTIEKGLEILGITNVRPQSPHAALLAEKRAAEADLGNADLDDGC